MNMKIDELKNHPLGWQHLKKSISDICKRHSPSDFQQNKLIVDQYGAIRYFFFFNQGRLGVRKVKLQQC